MKSIFVSLLVAVSLGANLLLLIGLVSPATVAPLAGLVRPGAAGAASTSSAAATPRRAKPSASASGQADAAGAVDWASLNSDDLATLLANLRAAGFTDREIRAILSARLQEKVAARRRELFGPARDVPYWKNQTTLEILGPQYTNPAVQSELRQMSRDNTKLLDSLLGPNPDASLGLSSINDKLQYGDLPADKVEQLKLINSDYSDLISAIQIAALGASFPEDRAKLKLLNEEKAKDIRDLLTPEEYDNYQLRSSSTASSMRSNLTAFEPTEAEFRKIFALQYAFDQQYSINMLGGMSREDSMARSAAQTDLTAQIKAALSPDRLADYERTTDSSYRQATALVSKLELPKDNATQLWSMQKDVQQRASALRTDRNLSADDRNAKLAALQTEATNRATTALGGQRGLDVYRQNGGQWIQSLVPTTAPAGAVSGSPGTIIFNGSVISF